MPKRQPLTHWKLMGRAACQPVNPNPSAKTTILNNDITCPKCKKAALETWEAIVRKSQQG